jgi:hypothetical protein
VGSQPAPKALPQYTDLVVTSYSVPEIISRCGPVTDLDEGGMLMRFDPPEVR